MSALSLPTFLLLDDMEVGVGNKAAMASLHSVRSLGAMWRNGWSRWDSEQSFPVFDFFFEKQRILNPWPESSRTKQLDRWYPSRYGHHSMRLSRLHRSLAHRVTWFSCAET